MKADALYALHARSHRAPEAFDPTISKRNRRIARWIKQAINPTVGPMQVVEFGFGDGELSRALLDELPGSHVLGFDIAEQRVEEASLAARRLNLQDRLEYRVLDVDDTSTSRASVGAQLVVAIDVLEHVFDVFGFVAQLSAMASVGGHVVLRVPNIAYIKHRIALARGELPVTASWFGPAGNLDAWRQTWGWDGGHLHFFTRATLDALLRSAGLRALAWGDPGTRLETLRAHVPGLLCGNLCVLARLESAVNPQLAPA